MPNNIELTRILESDLKKLYDMRNDVEIRKWCRQNDVLQWASHCRWFERQADDPSMQMYAIRLTGAALRNASEVGNVPVLGVAGLTSIDYINSRAEFSLYVGTEHQGAGYGREALIKLFRKGFEDYNLNLIWGESFDGNPAIKMFEDIGMAKEGTRKDFYFRVGSYINAHLYSITRKDFRKIHG